MAAGLAGAGCSFAVVERRPPVVEATTPSDCTDSYTTPIVDAAIAAALIGYSVYVAQDLADRDCDREECDGQDGVAVVMPLVYAVPFVFSGVWGARQVHRCRDMKEWQLAQPYLPPRAGEVGQRCIATDPGPGRCLSSSCIDGMCVDCAGPIAALEDARDAAARRQLWRAMPGGCRQVLASACSPLSPGVVEGKPYPASCSFYFSGLEAHR